MTTIILVVPIMINNPTVIYGLELLLGIVFAVFFPLLRKDVKQDATPATGLKSLRQAN